MPDTPSPNPGRPIGEFKARLNRDIAFTIIDEQVRSGIDQAQITGRGLAKQYGFGSPQTWVTHLKDWRQQHGHAPTVEEGVREAETVEGEPAAEPREDGGQAYGMISRSDFLQQQEMWNRLLAEREAAHAERLKVARLEGENAGRVTGREEGVALAEARERMLDERVRRERLEGERAGELRAQQDLAQRLRGERRLLVALAFLVGALAGGAALWWRLTPAAAAVPTVPPPTVPEATPLPVPMPPETKPNAEKPGEVKPVDVKPADIKPPEATPPEEPKPVDAPPPGEPVPAPP